VKAYSFAEEEQQSEHSQPTFFTEVETIDLALKLVHLLEVLHDKGLIYSNLCPEDVFLRGGDVNSMCFTSLFHCIGHSTSTIGIQAAATGVSSLDIRTRNSEYISPV
jgi:hypothetical protein